MSIGKELKAGALVNLFGVIGKMAAPILLVVVNRLYGTDIFGLFITANIAIEIIIAFLTSGFKDGAMIFVSRYADDEEHDNLYISLANAFTWSIGISLIVLIISIIFGDDLLHIAYKEEFNTGLSIMFKYMILAVPFMAFERIVLAATQGLKIMKYDAISNGWLRPIALLITSIFFWTLEPGVLGMALAYFSSQLLLFCISVYFYTRELSWPKLFRGFLKFKINVELLDFAIPQSINMTLNRFITGIDILMLPLFGVSPTVVGFYGAGSMIIREIRSIKMVFSTAFAPFIVRLHKEQKFEELSHHFSKTIGWIATLAIPVILLITIFKAQLLGIIHPNYTENTTFMYFLLPIPYLFCSFSLAGNVVAMTGHSRLTLMNSIIVASTNIVLNIFLIPPFGLIGAAIASAIAMLILNISEVVEARIVAQTKIYITDIVRPHLSGLAAGSFLAFALINIPWFTSTFIAQIALAGITLSIFALGVGKDLISKVKTKLTSK